MGLLSNLMSKIFGGHGDVKTPTSASSATAPAAGASGIPPTTAAAVPSAVPVTATSEPVDVTAILDGLAKSNPEKLDWKKSIVDLMKLVGMDSSLSARKELAKELHYPGDMSDSAEMNVWLHKQVIKKIAENGGKVPSDLLS